MKTPGLKKQYYFFETAIQCALILLTLLRTIPKCRRLSLYAPFTSLCSFLLYKLPIVPLAIRWLWFNVLKNVSIQPSWLFIRPGKNKSFTCNDSLGGSTHRGVSRLGPRSGNWLMEYDLEPLRETQPSDLRTDGIAQAPIMNFFSFSSSGWEGKQRRKWQFAIMALSWEGKESLWSSFFFLFFKQWFMKISTRLTGPIFRGRKPFKNLKDRSGKWKRREVEFRSISEHTGAQKKQLLTTFFVVLRRARAVAFCSTYRLPNDSHSGWPCLPVKNEILKNLPRF